jgi:hypothetical protein
MTDIVGELKEILQERVVEVVVEYLKEKGPSLLADPGESGG